MDHGSVSCLRRLAIVLIRTGLNLGLYPEPRPLTFNMTLKVKCQAKCYGFVTCPASCHLGTSWYACWHNFGMISGILYFDLEFHPEDQMQGQRCWLYELSGEASYHLRPFPYACWCNFQTISNVPHPLTLTLTLKVKCQVKAHGCVSGLGRLAVILDHFGTHAPWFHSLVSLYHQESIQYHINLFLAVFNIKLICSYFGTVLYCLFMLSFNWLFLNHSICKIRIIDQYFNNNITLYTYKILTAYINIIDAYYIISLALHIESNKSYYWPESQKVIRDKNA